ncbi:hypothetical protein [Paenibacillus whitsoniae]|uniref:Sporulation protein n=1 Tax=Paenibacillus whitsoniae TaxID=2496558 RepID=A0A3S0AC92_9BACL|nr:hypothetical protein [Paenibacillus whitsoniae]RTE09644.1 hypothetical protein EJQ19_11360 [Paenibacillus whitsoniae]
MFKALLKWTGSVVLIFGLAACGTHKTTDNGTYKTQNYKQDGMLGITSVNPNNPMNPTYHHYDDDALLMKAVLDQLPGVEKSKFAIHGPNVNVKVTPKAGLTPAQVEDLRSQAQMALDTNMPRYKINVTMVGR